MDCPGLPLYAISSCWICIICQNDKCQRQYPPNTLWPQIFRPLLEDMLWRALMGGNPSCAWAQHKLLMRLERPLPT